MNVLGKNRMISYVFANLPIFVFCLCTLFVLKVGIYAFTPFIIGAIMSYVLMPIVDRMEEYKISRGISSGLLVFLSFSIFVGLILLLLPTMYHKIVYIVNYILNNFGVIQIKLESLSKLSIDKLGMDLVDIDLIDSLAKKSVHSVESFFSNIWFSSGKIMTLMSMFFVSPVVVFYMLRDWRTIYRKVFDLVPLRYKEDFEILSSLIDSSLKSYVRGQIQICIVLGFFYGAIVWCTGLIWGFFIGFCVGFASIVPFLGYTVGVFFSMTIALMQFGSDWIRIFFVLFALCLGQLIEGNFITPRIMAENFKIHPSWVILGLFGCVEFFGTPGALLALPIVAMIKAFIIFFVNKYKKSDYFKEI